MIPIFFFVFLQIFYLLHMMEKRLFLGFCKLLLLLLDWNKKIILCLQRKAIRCALVLMPLSTFEGSNMRTFCYFLILLLV